MQGGKLKALVVGASGQLGSALLAALEHAGVSAVGTFRTKPAPGCLALDVRDAAAVRAAFAHARPDAVFWCVNNPGGVDWCEEHPAECRALHVDGAKNVFVAAAKANAKLVYFSTDYVFDGKNGPYSEDDEPNPRSVYAKAKAEGEALAREHCPGALVIRTTAVFGWDRRSNNFAMQVWERLEAGKELKVPGDQFCSPTLVDYLAEAAVRLVDLAAEGVVNVVGREMLSRADLAVALAKAMALDASLVKPVATAALGQAAPRPLKGGLKVDKLVKILGTQPWDLKESLNRFRRRWRTDTHSAKPKGAVSSKAEELRKEILEKVKEYCETAHKPRPFVPYQTRVQYSGRVYGAPEMTALADSALDFWLTMGPYGELFEGKMRKLFGSADFLAVNSGSTANLTAVMTLSSKQVDGHLKAGDEVVTPAVTFPTTLTPLVHAGLVPVFVDVEPGTYNIDPSLIKKALSKKTRAIMVPHTLGNPCDLDALAAICKDKGLWLVEDNCDALGSKWNGRLTGTFGALATLSFYPAHHITMGEGGGVIVNSARLSRTARSVRDWGRDCWCAPGESNTCGRRFGWQLGSLPRGYDHKYVYSNLGYNFKPTDMQCAVGQAQADRVPEFVAARRRNFQALRDGLQRYERQLLLPRWDKKAEPSWFAFPITVMGGITRAELVAHLEKANIETRELFGGHILRQPAFHGIKHRVSGKLPQTERVLRDSFFIGVYPGITDEMAAFVLSVFEEFFRR